MEPHRSADSGKSLEWLPKPSQATSCSHHAFGRNPQDSLPRGAARSKLVARNNFQLAARLDRKRLGEELSQGVELDPRRFRSSLATSQYRPSTNFMTLETREQGPQRFSSGIKCGANGPEPRGDQNLSASRRLFEQDFRHHALVLMTQQMTVE